MALMALGVNFETASLALRETLVFEPAHAAALVKGLLEAGGVREVLLLSTCNRTELYCEGPRGQQAFRWLSNAAEVNVEDILPHMYEYTDEEAVFHLMRVASGLDSMVLGEVEILGQLKAAYHRALNAGTLGKILSKLFQTTFAVAKQVRTQTSIGVNPISIATLFVRLAGRIFSDLREATVLLIGAGDLMRLTGLHLKQMGVKRILIANRTRSNAKILAEKLNAEVLRFEDIPLRLKEADVVITGTASILPILGKGMIERALKLRKRRPMLMLDLAVPRDIEPEVSELEDVYLYCIDDLRSLADENRKLRESAVLDAENIILKESKNFMSWMVAQGSLGTLKAFRQKFEIVRETVLDEALRQIKLGKSPEIVIQSALHKLTNRLLHTPTMRLRRAGFSEEKMILTYTKQLFELHDESIHSQ